MVQFRYLFLLSAFLSPLIISIGCGKHINSDEIKAQIHQEREEKDHYLMTSEESPFSPEEQENFQALEYFPIDLDYRIYTKIKEYESKDTITMVTTKEKEQLYLRYGEFQFSVGENTGTLYVYKPLKNDQGHPPYFFIPFYDKTNNSETYGGGRYLDIPIKEGDRYLVDFNRAYNPYCAYNYERWSCPLPPMENQLDFKVTAGEKIYPDAIK